MTGIDTAKGTADSQPIATGLNDVSWCSTLGSQMMKPRKPMFHKNTAAVKNSTGALRIWCRNVSSPVAAAVLAVTTASAARLRCRATRSAGRSQVAVAGDSATPHSQGMTQTIGNRPSTMNRVRQVPRLSR